VVTTVIWRFSDGKPGHDTQSRGLVQALSRRLPVRVCELAVTPGARALGWWLTHRYPPGERLPPPALLVGAGHATHLPMLAARRRHAARSVVLMKPTLPCACFDLCLVPRHDNVAPADNVLLTQGALNTVRRSDCHDADAGLIIIGGPSRHVRWDDDSIIRQLEDLQRRRPKARWWLTTSRRTPAALAARLRRQLPQLQCLPFAETAPEWLPARLAEAGEIWVTCDSVSMIYEALTSGARVGLLEVTGKGRGRIGASIDRLIDEGWLTAPGRTEMAAGPPQPLDEAARCADWIVRQWLNES
jgi:uncharacterized protein